MKYSPYCERSYRKKNRFQNVQIKVSLAFKQRRSLQGLLIFPRGVITVADQRDSCRSNYMRKYGTYWPDCHVCICKPGNTKCNGIRTQTKSDILYARHYNPFMTWNRGFYRVVLILLLLYLNSNQIEKLKFDLPNIFFFLEFKSRK